jgi:CubicO group peptidase (beta-lactamase class C family)
MGLNTKCCTGLLLCTLAHAAAGETSGESPQHSDRFAATRRIIEDAMVSENLPSIAVAVSRHGTVIWEEAFGWADVERRIPATPQTLYSLASVSKPITATALMTLVERGRIDLDRPIDDYLGATKLTAHIGSARDATVRRIASHTAGLPIHYQFFYADESRQRPPFDTSIALHGHLMHRPGESFIYSNFGYGLLDYVIERASGRPYGDYLRSAVFAPLGMRQSTIDPNAQQDVAVAVRYSNDRKPIPFYGFDAPGASAVYSSAHELLRFGMFHLGDALKDTQSVLSAASLREMHAPAEYADRPQDKSDGYGLGWGVGPMHGVETLHHTGGMAGVATSLVLIPDHDIALVVLANAETDRIEDIEAGIIATLLPKTTTENFAAAAALAGEWRGTIALSDRSLPVALSISNSGASRVRIDDRPAVDIPRVSLIESTYWFESVPEHLALPQLERRPAELQFGLRRRGDRLTGEATTLARTLPDRVGDAASFWIELQLIEHP